ncbi:MAG: putative esterase family protein [Chloroflexi bacterium OLB14]|nr:MAG: putative esterase family protein [Chloroflexi bacterium OLB14]
MRSMNIRQAIFSLIFLTPLLLTSACSSPSAATLPPTATSPAPTATATFTPSPIPPTPTATSLTCLTQAGEIKQDVVSTTNPPQEFLIYLPPCYHELTEHKYPVLYLLHGQTYTQDQWVKLGIPQIADTLIHSNQSIPFIIVFPDDRFWNLPSGASFGDRLINSLIPYIDATYRTLTDKQYRSLGGLSRGGGWTIQLGLQYPNLFGSLGLHSPAIFKENASSLEKLINNIPEAFRPRLWLDAGDNDRELESILVFEEILTRNNYLHESHFYTGDHSESYWSAHLEEYLRWYISIWNP